MKHKPKKVLLQPKYNLSRLRHPINIYHMLKNISYMSNSYASRSIFVIKKKIISIVGMVGPPSSSNDKRDFSV